MSRTSRVRAAVAVVAVALTASGCGSGGSGPVAGGRLPSRSTTTAVPPTAQASDTSAAPGGGGAAEGGSASGDATTEVALYFTRGEQVVRVARKVPKVTRIGAQAVKALLDGPNDTERAAGLATAIPTGVQFRDLVIEGGQARVDLSRTFESGGGGLGLTLRLAQLTCTLDAFPTVSGVRFALDGETVDVLSGDGVVVDRPVSCDSYREYVAEPDAGPVPAAAFEGIWPFASAAEVDAYANGSDATFLDPAATARTFALRYLGMARPVTFPFRSTGAGTGEVPVGFGTGEGGAPIADPQPTTVVALSQLVDHGDRSPWTVTGATSPDIQVDSPGPLARIGSPVAVSGRARVFEGTVTVEVREDGMTAGQSIGEGFVTGAGDVLGPFSGQIGFGPPSRPAGAIVFYERGAADGSALRATAVRVRF